MTVNVIEESQYPPVLTPLRAEVYSYQDQFPGSVIGRVHASDQDPHDILGYELLPAQGGGSAVRSFYRLFEIDRRTGDLVALQGLDVGQYRVNVSVSDGKFVSFQGVDVEVRLVTDSVLKQAVVLRLGQVSPEAFIANYRKNFIKILKNLFNVGQDGVEVLGLQPTFAGASRSVRSVGMSRRPTSPQSNLELLVAVKKDEGVYLPRSELRSVLLAKRHALAAQVGLEILGVVEDACEEQSCVNGLCIDEISMSELEMVTVSTDVSSLTFPQFQYGTVCQCKVGYGGNRCDEIANECYKEPCPSSKVCVPEASPEGYSCQCPPGLTGPSCNINVSTCKHSKCTVVNPLHFSGRSYVKYVLKRSVERDLSVSIGFRTLYSAATLMQARGLVEYSILEVHQGKLQYRFDFGSGEGLVRLNSKEVNDGLWHEVKLERHGNNAELAVDGKWRVHGKAPGLNDVFTLEHSEVYFGADVAELSGEDSSVSRGFVGCMDEITLDHEILPLKVNAESPVARMTQFVNVEMDCKELARPGVCGSHPCLNGGTCLQLDTPSGFACTCPARFSGATCEFDLDPCAGRPCLHGAECVNLENDYMCQCPERLSGKRCQYGKYCNPNPCQNKGVCEEDLARPICKCRGYTGEFCTIDVNECLHQNPCHNGGTCVNSPGGFHCICQGESKNVLQSQQPNDCFARRDLPKWPHSRCWFILELRWLV